jgi:hypothetical protein
MAETKRYQRKDTHQYHPAVEDILSQARTNFENYL